uniref:Uncharacterized protein n=1 Tax=Megaselia scalaris TaxID=36166 RepID=T1GUH8_MEGSC
MSRTTKEFPEISPKACFSKEFNKVFSKEKYQNQFQRKPTRANKFKTHCSQNVFTICKNPNQPRKLSKAGKNSREPTKVDLPERSYFVNYIHYMSSTPCLFTYNMKLLPGEVNMYLIKYSGVTSSIHEVQNEREECFPAAVGTRN